MTLSRRGFIGGLLAAPAIVAVGHLMPIRGIVMPLTNTVLVLSGTSAPVFTSYEVAAGAEVFAGDMLLLIDGKVAPATHANIPTNNMSNGQFIGVAVDSSNRKRAEYLAFERSNSLSLFGKRKLDIEDSNARYGVIGHRKTWIADGTLGDFPPIKQGVLA